MILTNTTDIRKKVGTFSLSDSLVRRVLEGDQHAQAEWQAIFSDTVVIECKSRWEYGPQHLFYTAHNPAFDVKPDGFRFPEYEPVVRRVEEPAGTTTYVAEWVRLDRP